MSTGDHTSSGVEALQRFYQAESEYMQTVKTSGPWLRHFIRRS
jgi:hypothetical protein